MIEIIILIIILSYREVGILCQRGSWDFNSFQKIFWDTDQSNLWLKNFDWFHVSNGLATLIICHILAQNIQFIVHIIPDVGVEWARYLDTGVYWLIWMYIRNVVIHIVIPLPWNRRYWFAVPIIGGWLDKYAK